MTAADRPYGEFYDFYSVSQENFGSTLVYVITVWGGKRQINHDCPDYSDLKNVHSCVTCLTPPREVKYPIHVLCTVLAYGGPRTMQRRSGITLHR